MMSALMSTRIARQLVARQGRLPGAVSTRPQGNLQLAFSSSGRRMMDADALITTRRSVERLAPTLRFRIAGVTFEQRQERVANLARGQALMLLHEPHNIYDKNAVAVRTMDGCDLGFVPRDISAQLLSQAKQGISFARVLSTGQNTEEKWGTSIGTQPSLLSCALQPMPFPVPESAQDPGSRAMAKALTESQGTCEVTGMSQVVLTQALRPLPCWRYDFSKRTVEMVRLAVVCPQVITCMERLRKISGPNGEQEHNEAVDLACNINGWERVDMEDHVSWFLDMEERMFMEKWSVVIPDEINKF
ncbi:hypothetical protein DUNSADRAFT_13378 [Dunaliella salina]|uniref:HIRAN domain-containing protein n=1 Tax=Dunaliella salina TaxID=3046 RepID=A0ABQ7G9F9_DUNSA|nr:hypothetical protein DUNSADRAFT_13378 [Dunaliella salina]|eukprot:KAF5831248.1 hypothetical protein DUNSADRAFT_13378 [Dunaliella salina]